MHTHLNDERERSRCKSDEVDTRGKETKETGKLEKISKNKMLFTLQREEKDNEHKVR